MLSKIPVNLFKQKIIKIFKNKKIYQQFKELILTTKNNLKIKLI